MDCKDKNHVEDMHYLKFLLNVRVRYKYMMKNLKFYDSFVSSLSDYDLLIFNKRTQFVIRGRF